MVLALKCEQTHVISFMIEFGLSGRSHQDIPAIRDASERGTVGHHALSHDRSVAGIAALVAIETWQAQRFGSFLGKLKAAQDSAGNSLLDQTLVLAIPSMGSGYNHNHKEISPKLIGGGGIVNNQGGRAIDLQSGQTQMLGHFHAAILDAYGIPANKKFGKSGLRFGDSGERAMTGIL